MLRKTLVLSVAASCTALSPATRRDLLRATPVVAAPFLAAPANAEDFQASLKPLYKAAKTAKLTYRSKAGEPPPEAWAEDAFVGRYTDPINHPGGIRDITLTDTFIGEYRPVHKSNCRVSSAVRVLRHSIQRRIIGCTRLTG